MFIYISKTTLVKSVFICTDTLEERDVLKLKLDIKRWQSIKKYKVEVRLNPETFLRYI
jgi:hypothetical protein